MPIHLRPTAQLAERVLLPGDPGRALALAQSLLGEPRMFNHHRGLWGYTGAAPDGEPLTIQATGMGGPSAAIVLSELIELGVTRAIRVGTCGALAPGLALGRAADRARGDRRGRHLAGARRGRAILPRTRRSRGRSPRPRPRRALGTIVSVDLFYDSGAGGGHEQPGALAMEMEAAALFALGARAQVAVGCMLIVTDTFDAAGARARIDEHALLSRGRADGRGRDRRPQRLSAQTFPVRLARGATALAGALRPAPAPRAAGAPAGVAAWRSTRSISRSS